MEAADEDGGEPSLVKRCVEPLMDRLVVFRSWLEHEVQPAHFDRMALTSWFVNRKHQGLELLAEQLSIRQAAAEAAGR